MRWLLDHGADANARSRYRFTPLSEAAYAMQLEAVQVLLEHNADINSQNNDGETPLYWVLTTLRFSGGKGSRHRAATTGAWGRPKYL